jgi:integrase/recombinase XerD
MLSELLPKSHNQHRSLPILGSVLDDFDDWLVAQGYRFFTRQCYILRCTAIERYFRKHHQHHLSGLTSEHFCNCQQFHRDRPGGISVVVRCLHRFLKSRQLLSLSTSPPATPFSSLLDSYCQYLREVRGLAAVTIGNHYLTACEFVHHCVNENKRFRFSGLTRDHVEKFVCSVSNRFDRSSLQHVIGRIRGLLRFLEMRGEGPAGLSGQIDTPRVYRLERLPRALPWNTVCEFLRSIDRSCTSGLRDYAIFLLIVTYGLRGCDIAGLKLSDVDWRAGKIQVNQSKTKHPICLPLTDQVAEALLVYLRRGRQRSRCREIFLTLQAPVLPMRRQAIGDAFRKRVKSSSLEIPFLGVHCLRHSYAAHLLRQGVSLKNIGDILGHHSTESTCVYLRLNVEDLREVPLPLPAHYDQRRPS